MQQPMRKQTEPYLPAQGRVYIYTPQTNIRGKNLLIPSPVSHRESRSKAVTQTPHVVPQPPPTQDPPWPGPAMKYKPVEVTAIDLSRKAPSVMHAQKLPAHSPAARQYSVATRVFVGYVCDCFSTCLIFFGEWIHPNGNIYSSAHVSNMAGDYRDGS